MKKKELKNAIAAIEARLKKNTLSEDAQSLWEEVRAAFEALAEDEAEHDITELKDKFEELAAKFDTQTAEAGEQVAEKIQVLRNEVMGMFNAAKKAADAITPAIRKEIINAINKTRGGRDEVADAVKSVLKKNDITGLDLSTAIRIAVEFESKPTALFDAFGRTDLDKIYLIGIDESDKDQIAKEWKDAPEAVKEVQQLAASGITFETDYIYKQQRMAQAAMDDAREHGVLEQVEGQTTAELEQQVKRLAEKAAIVGDNINEGSAKVHTFYAIGKVTQTNGRVAVVHPEGATPTILDLAKAADAVDGEVAEKVCVISKTLARTLSAFKYSENGSLSIISDAQLASQIGVDRLVKVDYLNEVQGLQAVILKPDAYKVRIKNEMRVAYPKYEKNSIYYLFEMNMAGNLTQLKSAAVLTTAGGSSRASR